MSALGHSYSERLRTSRLIATVLLIGFAARTSALAQSAPKATADVEAHRLAAQRDLSAGDLTGARRNLAAAIAIADSPDDHVTLGEVHAREERFALAAEQFERAIELGLDEPAVHLALANAYDRLANDVGRRLVVQRPGESAGTISDGVYLLRPLEGKPDLFVAAPPASAIYQVQRAIDLGIETPSALLLRADVLLNARSFDLAVSAYRALAEHGGELTATEQKRLYHGFAEALYCADDVEGFLEYTRKALGLEPEPAFDKMASAYRRAAERYNQRGDVREYIRYLELAVAETPNDADLHYDLGIGYWEAGDRHQAVRQWRMALELAPDHPEKSRMLQWLAGSA